MIDVLNLLKTKAYDFLRTNEHLKDKILFLCLGGSHSYGTNIETSDVDIRGVALETLDDILGVTHFEQFENKETDTVIYSLSKFLDLVTNCNPNVIEMLYCKPEHYFYVSPLGQKLLDNRHLFLSKKAKYTFAGYAHAQLNRLENALAGDDEKLSNKEVKTHINRSVENTIYTFKDRYNVTEDEVKSYVDVDAEGKEQIYVDFNLKKCLLGNLREMIEQMTNVLKDFENTVGQRNKKKDDLHLNKHMMHLIRLYVMSIEIFETNDLHTYREKEHDLLMSIRNGAYRREDGGVKKEFYDLLNSLETRLNTAVANSTLPDKPRKKEIDALRKNLLFEGVFKNLLVK